jgi:hypothetical protein
MRHDTRYGPEFEAALPRIRLHARIYFRDVVCPHKKADLIAEAVGLSFKWWVRLRARGKVPTRFVSAIATYAARAAKSGRRVCGHERARDVLSPVAQQRHGFAVKNLPSFSSLLGNPFDEALHDNTVTPPDEQVAFRIDFPCWFAGYDERRRSIIRSMMTGEQTQRLATLFGISEGRVSQLRREFKEDWDRFTGDD